MDENIKEAILEVIDESLERLRLSDFAALKEISDHTIHIASIYQDTDSISVAVIMYALSKLGDRPRDPPYLKKIRRLLESCKKHLRSGADEQHRKCVKAIFKLISEYDIKFKLYIDEVLEKAQVKKGSKLHEHGISMARTAEILGIGQWELMSYIGKTRIHDEFLGKMDVKRRIGFARELFR